jgi:hypothetical protein
MTDAREIRYQISLAQWWAFGSVCVLVAPLEISERPLLVHRRAACVAVVERAAVEGTMIVHIATFDRLRLHRNKKRRQFQM